MKNLAHSASLDSADEDAPSKPGIKHLALILYATSGLTSPTIGATKAAMSGKRCELPRRPGGYERVLKRVGIQY